MSSPPISTRGLAITVEGINSWPLATSLVEYVTFILTLGLKMSTTSPITLPTESGSMTLDMNWNETKKREKLCEEGHMRSEILKAFYRRQKGLWREIKTMNLAWFRSIKRDSIHAYLFWERTHCLSKQFGFFKIVKGTC